MLTHARSCGRSLVSLILLALTACGGSSITTPTPVTPTPPPVVVASIYGANAPNGVGVLTVLSTGDIASSTTIPVPGLANPGTTLVGIAVDAPGEIFVTEQLTLSSPGTLGSSLPTGAILVFAPGAGAGAVPIRTISGAFTLLTTPQSLAADAAGNLYVAQGSGDILEFSAGASGNIAPVRTLKGFLSKNTGVGFVLGMGVDPGGSLYVMNADIGTGIYNILVFSPTQDGDVAPVRSLAGSATLLAGNILGGSFDAAGNLYVVTGAGLAPASTAILEFAAGADGNVAPIREITGTNTMVSGSYVSNPVLDSAGNIYVQAFAPGSTPNILRFGSSANGNALPSAISASGPTISSFAIALY